MPGFIALRFLDLRDLLLQPRVFFQRHEKSLRAPGGIPAALAAAMAFKGAAALVNAYWLRRLVIIVRDEWLDLMSVGTDLAFERPEAFRSWMDAFGGFGSSLMTGLAPLTWGVVGGSIRVLAFAFAVHVALHLWPPVGAARRAGAFATTLKIVCYAQAPVLVAIVPGAGIAVGWLLALSATAFGLGQVYGGGWVRGMGYAVFPYMLLSAAFMLGLCAVAFLLFQLITGLH